MTTLERDKKYLIQCYTTDDVVFSIKLYDGVTGFDFIDFANIKADGNTVLNQGLRMPGRHSEFTLKKPGSLLERISCEKVHFDVTPAAEAHSYESYEQPQMKLMEVPFAAFDEIRKEVK